MSHSAAEPARLVYDSLPSAVLVLGRGGHVLHANQAAEQVLATPLAAMRARQPDEVWRITAADGSALGPGEQLGMSAVDSGQAERGVLRRLCRPDGRWLDLEVDTVPSLGADGRAYQVVCTLNDVTERRRIEARVRQSEREWRQLFQNAGIGMARLDLRGKILRANPLLCQMLGYEAAALEGRPLADILLPEDSPNLSFAMLAEFDLPRVESDVRYLGRQGKPIWVHSVVSLVRDGQGRPAFLINTVEDISARKAREAELEHRVLHDVLTGLPNRTLLNDRLLHAVRSARRTGTPLALLVLGIDGLIQVNTKHGHVAGDRALIEVAERMSKELRKSDTVARIGGGEFAVILTGVGDPERAGITADKLLAAIEARLEADRVSIKLTASAGVALYPADGTDPESLLRSADLAMQAAKRRRLAAGREGMDAEGAGDAESGTGTAHRRPVLSADDVNRRIDNLERVALLMPLAGEQIRRLARRMSERTVPAGSTMNRPGQPAAALQIIESGICEVLTDSDPAQPLLVRGPGDFVGTSMILGEPATVTARALTDCRVLEASSEVLATLIPNGSELHEELRRVAEQRRDMLSRLVAQAGRTRSNSGARTIAVYSPKGGSGKSTLAVNLAAALARTNEDDVLLIDLALPYNHAALLARLSPTTCLARTVHADTGGFEMALRAAMLRHASGFMVLSTALRPEEADLITTELVTRTLEIVGGMYRYIVFDLGIALSDPVLAALEASKHIVPVITPELTSMKDASQFMEILGQVLHVPAGSVHLVVNHRTPEAGMTRADVERVLGRRVAVEVAYDGARPEQAALRGEFLALTQPRSGIARGTAQLAATLSAATPPTPQPAADEEGAPRGWFGYALS